MTGGTESAQQGRDAEVAEHLQRLLASDGLAKSATNKRLLTYLVQRYEQGSDGPKETEIAIDVFGRDASFHGGDDSVVRVAMRGLRQKLLEYYASQGKDERLVFDIPKGSYRLRVERRHEGAARDGTPAAEAALHAASVPAAPNAPGAAAREPGRTRRWAAVPLLGLLIASLAVNLYYWRLRQPVDPELERVRGSLLWKDFVASDRPVMFVLGDIFMYTQTDPVTGRVQTVRDPQIGSSDDLRAFLANHPELAAGRGQRYSSFIQKSTTVGMATLIPIVGRPGRVIEVRLRDELRTEDLGRYDIIYVGPFSRIGPLDALLQGVTRYRFDATSSGVADAESGKVYLPEGELANHRKDYAVISGFRGPQGTRILILTAGGRNAGLGQVIRTVTTPEGLAQLDGKLQQAGVKASGAFEVLLSVAGYKQTDLSADVLDVRRLPM